MEKKTVLYAQQICDLQEDNSYDSKEINSNKRTGFIQASLSKIQGLLKDFPAVFKFMKNTDLSVKCLLQKC